MEGPGSLRGGESSSGFVVVIAGGLARCQGVLLAIKAKALFSPEHTSANPRRVTLHRNIKCWEGCSDPNCQ